MLGQETGRGADMATAAMLAGLADGIGRRPHAKWDLRVFLGDRSPYEYKHDIGLILPKDYDHFLEVDKSLVRGNGLHVDGNLILNAGWALMIDKLLGLSGQVIDATHCRLGVGNGTTAVTAADTDLAAAAGAGNRQFNLVDATYPQRSGSVLALVRATFATGDANFVWNEFGTDAGTANGTAVTAVLFNRKVQAGILTKSSAVSVVATETITFT